MKKLTLTLFALLLASFSFADSILIEGFEYANHDNATPVGWTCDNESWLCGYQEKDHNRIPHTGNWYAYTNAEESWMYMPLFLSADLKYRFSAWVISDGSYELEFWGGNGANPSQMVQCLQTFEISQNEYEKVAVYIETLSSNYEYFGIHAISHEGASYLTIDDVAVDMVAKYEFITNPFSADTVLYPGSVATHHFDVQNTGYMPINVILSPSHEYFSNIHFLIDGVAGTTFSLQPDETKHIIAEATLLSSIPAGSVCWLDIMLLLDCDCATAITTLWVNVVEPAATSEHQAATTAFPNPANNHININAQGLQQVEITDVFGKKINTMVTHCDEVQIDLSMLSPGLYFVTTITGQGSKTQKIIKQ